MKVLVRVFFVSVMLVSAFTCFANEAAELRELNNMILYPITRHFNESSSITKCMSLEIMKFQIQNKRQANQVDFDQLWSELESKPWFCEAESNIVTARSHMGCPLNLVKSVSITGFAKSHQTFWQLQAANCGELSEFALIAFTFNWINNEKMQQPHLFKKAVLVTTKAKTGDHQLLLVEGVSETLFVVDPWLRSVLPLKKYFPLTGFIIGQEISSSPKMVDMIPLSERMNSQLTSLYRDKDSGYYDGYSVVKNTQWVLQVAYSKRIQSFAYTYNEDMKNFYNILKDEFSGFVKAYDELPLKHIEQSKSDKLQPKSSELTGMTRAETKGEN